MRRQGVEAQTLANVYHAIDANHEIVPVLNKIDLPAAESAEVKQQIEDVIGLDASDALEISAKTGLGIDTVLEAIVHRLPAPKGDINAPLKALLVDSWYDTYLGVVVLIRVIDGTIKKGQQHPHDERQRRLRARPGRRVHAQDWSTSASSAPARSASSPPPSSRSPTPMSATPSPTTGSPPRRRCPASGRRSRWCSAACSRSTPPISRSCATRWASSASTMRASRYEMETSAALGFGFRCGFLGLLHLEIIQERLGREFDLDLIATAPSVVYEIALTNGETHGAAQPGRHARRRRASRKSASPGSRRRS